MEYFDGMTLYDLLRTPLSKRDALRISRGVASGLKHIHGAGLVHADLHERNILVNPNQVKIIDILYSESASLAKLSSNTTDFRQKMDIKSLRRIIEFVLDSSPFENELPGEIRGGIKSSESIEEIANLIEQLADSIGSTRFRTLIDCQKDFYNRIFSSGSNELLVDIIGLDLSQGGDRLRNLLRSDRLPRSLQMRLLRLDSDENLDPKFPESVLEWAKFSSNGMSSVERVFKQFDARQKELNKSVHQTVRAYRELPRFHGFSISGSEPTVWLSACHWTPDGDYVWGEEEYLVSSSDNETMFSYLYGIFRGEFNRLWENGGDQFEVHAGV